MKNEENRSLGFEKLRKMGTGGASKRQQNAKLEKIGVVSNCAVPFLSILEENGSQDGGQNPLKIDKKSIQNLKIFLIGFWMHFGRDLGAKMEEKSMQKRCQKHVGIDLLLIFIGFRPPSWLPFSTQIDKKRTTQLSTTQNFFNFAFCCLLEALPVPIFLDYGAPGLRFLKISSSF